MPLSNVRVCNVYRMISSYYTVNWHILQMDFEKDVYVSSICLSRRFISINGTQWQSLYWMRLTIPELCDWITRLRLHSIFVSHSPQGYVSWYNSFICQNYILLKKTAENHVLLDIFSRSILALDHEHTLLDLFLRSRSQLIFIPLVLRGHNCHIVIFLKKLHK